MTIAPATTSDDVDAARVLFEEYARSLGFSLCFQGFDEELRTLPGKYAPPRGVILLARDDEGRALGCVALRPLDAERCEMKRLYVRLIARGRGLGRLLAAAIVDEARRIGYADIVLDTIDSMTEALALYRSLEFEATEPYTPNPLQGATYLRLDLRPPTA